MIRRSYIITDKENGNGNETKSDRLDKVYEYVEQRGCKITHGEIYKEDFKNLGIVFYSEEYEHYCIEYDSQKALDFIEKDIIKFAKNLNLGVERLKAYIDYDKVLSIFVEKKNLKYITEEIFYIYNDDERSTYVVDTIKEKIKELCLNDNSTLIITDPYFMSCGNSSDSYQALLRNIFNDGKKYKIKLFKPRGNEQIFNEFKNNMNLMNKDAEVICCNNIHDRFWVCPENRKGFVMGTSLNGLGRKFCYISMMNQEDVESVLRFINEID